jgi:hypothetical protein
MPGFDGHALTVWTLDQNWSSKCSKSRMQPSVALCGGVLVKDKDVGMNSDLRIALEERSWGSGMDIPLKSGFHQEGIDI